MCICMCVCVCVGKEGPGAMLGVAESPCPPVQSHPEKTPDSVQGQDSSWSGSPGHPPGWHLHAGTPVGCH